MPFQIHPPKRSDLPPLVFSALAGLILSFTTGSIVFSFISAGRDLGGRNAVIQAVFYTAYFLLITGVLFFVFRRQINNLLIKPLFVISLFSLAPLAAYAYVGSFSRFVADDFSSASLVVTKGVWGATWDWYVNWSGRFTASFFDSLAGFLGPSWQGFAAGSAIFLILLGMTDLGVRYLHGDRDRRKYTALFISSLILISTFFIAPDLPQALYWGQGMRSLIFPLIPLFLELVILFDRQNLSKPSNRVPLMIILGLLSFFAGGFGETFVVIQTTLFGLVLLYAFFSRPLGFKKPLVFPVFIALAGSIAAIIVTVLAPGNHVRQSYFPPAPGVFKLFSISLDSFGQFFVNLVKFPTNIWCLLILSILSYLSGSLYAIHNSTREPEAKVGALSISLIARRLIPFILLLLAFAVLLFISFVPSAYGMSTFPPDRTLVLPSFILCMAISVLLFSAGRLTGSLPFVLRLSAIVSSQWVSLLSILMLGLLSYFASAHILRVIPDYRFFAEHFDRADQMIREAKIRGESSVSVPEVHNHYGLSDYGEGTTYWLDNAVDTYYGLHVIINKNMK